MSKTAGKWDPSERPVYFIAGGLDSLRKAAAMTKDKPLPAHLLVAVNEVSNEGDFDTVGEFIATGNRLLIDSGVFWLATQHANKNNIPMDVAIGLPPTEVNGFDALYSRYMKLIKAFGESCWGYIEIDQGGRVNKTKTRAKLEAEGLRPIPVYHPLNDGWDYFDELAKKYDRICIGNMVKASTAVRIRLLATLWQRTRDYPDLWLHWLGLAPTNTISAWPIQSCDSSAWLNIMRYGVHDATLANNRYWPLGHRFNYLVGNDEGRDKAYALCACDAMFRTRIMQQIAQEQQKVTRP